MALTIGDNFSYMGAKPLDARLKYDTVAAMKAMVDSTLYEGCLAYCMATEKTYQWKSTNTVDPNTGKWREFESGGGGGSYTAGDGIVIDNDEISVDEMASADMAEVASPMPSVMSRRFKYSTEEQIVGEWIDGKPIWQRVFHVTSLQNDDAWHIIANIPNISFSMIKDIICKNPSGDFGVETSFASSQHIQVKISSNGNLQYALTYALSEVYIIVQYTKTTD